MPNRIPRICGQPGCGVETNGDTYCPAHRGRNNTGRTLRPLEKLYHQKSFTKLFRPRFRSLNPICQRLEDGEQCHKPGSELHHLKEPTTPAEFFDPKNCISLCPHHHPGGRAGTPEWTEGKDYVPTVWHDVSLG